ncbi:AAA family ATPase [Rhodoferax sp. AJA081-3]|nr:AAA family ATPase [Rhodoferax sp. AJA081-3]
MVVSGLPASGKTTLAASLAASLQLPFLDKDSFLEALFLSEGTGNSAWRRALSKRADEQFQEEASAMGAAVITSWWKHPASTTDSGTPVDWLSYPSRIAVEVHCVCSASVAASRFLARQRHPGHLDERWSHDRLLVMLEAHSGHGPLFPDRAITINTEQLLRVQDIVHTIQANAFGKCNAKPVNQPGWTSTAQRP